MGLAVAVSAQPSQNGLPPPFVATASCRERRAGQRRSLPGSRAPRVAGQPRRCHERPYHRPAHANSHQPGRCRARLSELECVRVHRHRGQGRDHRRRFPRLFQPHRVRAPRAGVVLAGAALREPLHGPHVEFQRPDTQRSGPAPALQFALGSVLALVFFTAVPGPCRAEDGERYRVQLLKLGSG